MEDLYIELKVFMMKNIALFSVFIGAVLKASVDIKNKALTFKYRLVNVIMSIGGGFATTQLLYALKMEEWIGFIVPLATLFTETIITWVMSHSDMIINTIFNKFKNK